MSLKNRFHSTLEKTGSEILIVLCASYRDSKSCFVKKHFKKTFLLWLLFKVLTWIIEEIESLFSLKKLYFFSKVYKNNFLKLGVLKKPFSFNSWENRIGNFNSPLFTRSKERREMLSILLLFLSCKYFYKKI
jgi:hypothetical protein